MSGNEFQTDGSEKVRRPNILSQYLKTVRDIGLLLSLYACWLCVMHIHRGSTAKPSEIFTATPHVGALHRNHEEILWDFMLSGCLMEGCMQDILSVGFRDIFAARLFGSGTKCFIYCWSVQRVRTVLGPSVRVPSFTLGLVCLLKTSALGPWL